MQYMSIFQKMRFAVVEPGLKLYVFIDSVWLCCSIQKLNSDRNPLAHRRKHWGNTGNTPLEIEKM